MRPADLSLVLPETVHGHVDHRRELHHQQPSECRHHILLIRHRPVKDTDRLPHGCEARRSPQLVVGFNSTEARGPRRSRASRARASRCARERARGAHRGSRPRRRRPCAGRCGRGFPPGRAASPFRTAAARVRRPPRPRARGRHTTREGTLHTLWCLPYGLPYQVPGSSGSNPGSRRPDPARSRSSACARA